MDLTKLKTYFDKHGRLVLSNGCTIREYDDGYTVFDVYNASIDDITTHDFESTLHRAAHFNTEKTARRIVNMVDDQTGRELDTDAIASLVKIAMDITANEVLQDTIDEIG